MPLLRPPRIKFGELRTQMRFPSPQQFVPKSQGYTPAYGAYCDWCESCELPAAPYDVWEHANRSVNDFAGLRFAGQSERFIQKHAGGS